MDFALLDLALAFAIAIKSAGQTPGATAGGAWLHLECHLWSTRHCGAGTATTKSWPTQSSAACAAKDARPCVEMARRVRRPLVRSRPFASKRPTMPLYLCGQWPGFAHVFQCKESDHSRHSSSKIHWFAKTTCLLVANMKRPLCVRHALNLQHCRVSLACTIFQFRFNVLIAPCARASTLVQPQAQSCCPG